MYHPSIINVIMAFVTRGGTAGAGPARGGWPLPACGEPMRIKPHQTEILMPWSWRVAHTSHMEYLIEMVQGLGIGAAHVRYM